MELPAGDVSHKPGGRLPLLSARPAVTLATLKRTANNFAAWWTEARWVWTVCIKTITRQRRDCDLNPGPNAPESSTLTTGHRRRKGSVVGWGTMASAEHEPITGVWGQSPQRGPGESPWSGGQGDEAPLKLKAFWSLDVQRSRQI